MIYTYKTQGTCSSQIIFDLDDNDIVSDIKFIGGCNGNLKAICVLLNGKKADEIIDMLLGNTCGSRPTSCTDQLAKALQKIKSENT